MTPDRLRELREALADLPPAPWNVGAHYPGGWAVVAPNQNRVGLVLSSVEVEAVCTLRNAAPELLDAIDSLRTENALLRQTIEDIYSDRRENPHGF